MSISSMLLSSIKKLQLIEIRELTQKGVIWKSRTVIGIGALVNITTISSGGGGGGGLVRIGALIGRRALIMTVRGVITVDLLFWGQNCAKILS